MKESNSPLWTQPPHPEWLAAMNREGSYFNLSAVVPLDEDSLLHHARRATGLKSPISSPRISSGCRATSCCPAVPI